MEFFDPSFQCNPILLVHCLSSKSMYLHTLQDKECQHIYKSFLEPLQKQKESHIDENPVHHQTPIESLDSKEKKHTRHEAIRESMFQLSTSSKMTTSSMMLRVIITCNTFVPCTLFSGILASLVFRKTHSTCSYLYICCKRKCQKPIITMAQSLYPYISLNSPEVSKNLFLNKTVGPVIPMKKKPFVPLLPTELPECITIETEQVCQDLCRQNYPFTNHKQICS